MTIVYVFRMCFNKMIGGLVKVRVLESLRPTILVSLILYETHVIVFTPRTGPRRNIKDTLVE